MKRAHLWPIGITGVLAATVAANLWVMRVASADPSFAIEPNYYAKAVQWDSTLAQEARNRALGWRVVPALRMPTAQRGAILDVRVIDADGTPVRDAVVRVTAFAVARSATRVDATLTAARDVYSVALPIAHDGAWELRFDVRKGDDRFTVTHRVDANRSTTVGLGAP